MTKICTRCGKELPATLEYFSSRKRNKDGLHELCKACRTERDKAYRREHIEKYHETTKAWKETNKERINAVNAAYAETHKDRKSETNKAWYERNKDRKNAMVKEWAALNKERRRATIAAWRKANGDKCKAIIKKYRRANPDKIAAWEETRRSRKKNLPATLTKDQWDKTLRFFGNECAYCGERGKLAQEHFVAVVNGGGYTVENIIPACKRCNSSKKDKLFEEWYPEQAFYTAEREAKILRAVGRNAVK